MRSAPRSALPGSGSSSPSPDLLSPPPAARRLGRHSNRPDARRGASRLRRRRNRLSRPEGRPRHERGRAMATEEQQRERDGAVATAEKTLSVTDNRTGKKYELEITDGTVRAMDFREIKVDEDDFG